MTHSLVHRVTPALVTGEGRAFDEPTKLWAVRRSRREPLSHGRERLVEVELAERALTAVWVELAGLVQQRRNGGNEYRKNEIAHMFNVSLMRS